MSIEQLENSKNAITLLDKILPHLPDYTIFHFATYAKEVLGWSATEIREIVLLQPFIIDVAINHFQYLSTRHGEFVLTDKGREAKSKGGHFSYLQYLDDNKKLEAERLERKDKSDKLDLLMKEWQVRTKKLPYILSGLALCGTIISISISFRAINKKSDQPDLQPMQQQIQLLQDRVKLLDSLHQADTLLKKHSE